MNAMRMSTVMALTAGFGLVVHPLGMGVAWLLGQEHAGMSLGSFFFAGAFALVPLLVLVGGGGGLALGIRKSRARTWGLVAGAWSAPLFALAAQVLGWSVASKDAQGALAFLFLPTYAAMASGLLALAVFLACWLAERLRRA
ncbi:hypothetical protein EJ065_0659 [Corallococcus coralloides]|uniref:Uncharacterized protein n=1 Tax=Corallococcus coralloides TaxID=184914 RepID=A0A410RK67_CORCK|nr:hypothetical protein [Corallococcus coralloides]QAT82266.1 hypothetical protein EJ065_0659 [Corallococcus coralloides]